MRAEMSKGHDVRAVANVVLREAKALNRPISNLQLNKIIYFMHVEWLRTYGLPLVSAKLEAWEHGPVFREVYNQFKQCGKSPISGFALKVDFDSGERVVAEEKFDRDTLIEIRKFAEFYSSIPTRIIYDMAHAKGGAWDTVWHHKGAMNVGMEITNDLIRDFEVPLGKRIRIQ